MSEMTIDLSIPLDIDGYILLECSHCGEQFKLLPHEVESEEVINVCCPQCGLISDSYLSDKVIELAICKSKNIMLEQIHNSMKQIERRTKNSLIQFKAGSLKQEFEPDLIDYVDDYEEIQYSCCNRHAKLRTLLVLSGSFCPYCGEREMQLTNSDFKIMYKKFMTASNRMMKASFEEYGDELKKFVTYLENEPTIIMYIKSCGEPEYNPEEEFQEVKASYGNSIFSLGSTVDNEVANIYSILKYLSDIKINGRSTVFYGYSSSKKFQDKVDGFGDRFIRILITHIESYLSELGIKNGLENKQSTNIHVEQATFNQSQVNIANGQSTINSSLINKDNEDLTSLIESVKILSGELTSEEKEAVQESLEVIDTIREPNKKKSLIKTAITTIKGIKGSVEFMSAVASLAEYISKLL